MHYNPIPDCVYSKEAEEYYTKGQFMSKEREEWYNPKDAEKSEKHLMASLYRDILNEDNMTQNEKRVISMKHFH